MAPRTNHRPNTIHDRNQRHGIGNSGPVDETHPMLAFQAQYVPDLRLSFIEGAGHWNQQEKPNETNTALLEFLAEVSPIN